MMQRWPEKCYPRGKKDETQSSRDRHPKELRAFVDSLSKKQLQEIREECLDGFADAYRAGPLIDQSLDGLMMRSSTREAVCGEVWVRPPPSALSNRPRKRPTTWQPASSSKKHLPIFRRGHMRRPQVKRLQRLPKTLSSFQQMFRPWQNNWQIIVTRYRSHRKHSETFSLS